MTKFTNLLTIATVLGAASMAHAAGFQLTEYSTTNLGRAFAGMGVVGDDYSATAYNPAGMNFNEKSGMQLGASTVTIKSKVRGSVSNLYRPTGTTPPIAPIADRTGREDPYIIRVLPYGFAQYKLNDRTTAGLGVYTPFGLVTDYGNSWFGHTHAGRSVVESIDVSPSLAYKVTDEVSVGGAINIQRFAADFTNVVEKNVGTVADPLPIYLGGKTHLRGDDTNVGYTLGTTWEPVKNSTRFGLSYRSKIHHKLHGKNTIEGASPISGINPNGTKDIHAQVTTPEMIIFSGYQKITDKWSVSAAARFTRWSRFKDLTIYNEGESEPLSRTVEKWQNIWFYSLGTDYQVFDSLTWRFGVGHDTSAVRSASLRTACVPDAARTWISTGFSYTRNNWQLDGGYAHLFVDKVRATHGPDGSSDFNAKYGSDAHIFSLSAQYKF